MKTFLVPQEQSLVLKELGFDKKCWGVWVNGRFEPRYKSKNSTFNPCQKLDKRNVDYCTAPTFEQAFDWFREKYKLDGYVFSNSSCRYTLVVKNLFSRNTLIETPFNFKDTYQEARQACLEKLIELC